MSYKSVAKYYAIVLDSSPRLYPPERVTWKRNIPLELTFYGILLIFDIVVVVLLANGTITF